MSRLLFCSRLWIAPKAQGVRAHEGIFSFTTAAEVNHRPPSSSQNHFQACETRPQAQAADLGTGGQRRVSAVPGGPRRTVEPTWMLAPKGLERQDWQADPGHGEIGRPEGAAGRAGQELMARLRCTMEGGSVEPSPASPSPSRLTRAPSGQKRGLAHRPISEGGRFRTGDRDGPATPGPPWPHQGSRGSGTGQRSRSSHSPVAWIWVEAGRSSPSAWGWSEFQAPAADQGSHPLVFPAQAGGNIEGEDALPAGTDGSMRAGGGATGAGSPQGVGQEPVDGLGCRHPGAQAGPEGGNPGTLQHHPFVLEAVHATPRDPQPAVGAQHVSWCRPRTPWISLVLS